ncbi:hypothetical protein RHSIM_Rhsim11G0183200 [Rhododendron simsii]|uniref:F-box associated domain-containing protein n=1 Tax=Rhododendron simsii TaxID=118357 RepID=A0A834GAN8_RHOSS|nr:hypothetical protein RHSIM_Rhsim11G0183200 [Rhododendron simsii]
MGTLSNWSLDESDGHDLGYDPVMKFDLRVCYPDGQILLVGSVNGLLCFCDYTNECLFICNPTVRQYVTVPEPKHKTRYPSMIVYGFGFSSISGQYKLVQIYQKALSDPALGNCSYENLGEVYTLGTGKWRSIGTVPFEYDLRLYSVTLNGNIHWLICDMESPYSICAFDIENESFRGFSSVPGLSRGTLYKSLGLLEGRLCVCDNSSNSDLVIWVMKEYGVSESWTKEIVIRLESDLTCLLYAQVTPIKVWRNGDILMLWRDDFLCSYNPERNSLEQVVVPRESAHIVDRFIIYEMMLHVASFCSLKDFAMEKVQCGFNRGGGAEMISKDIKYVDDSDAQDQYLWRRKHTFAIAQHQLHHTIYEEADASKRRKRYARPLIDLQMEWSHGVQRKKPSVARVSPFWEMGFAVFILVEENSEG